MCNWWQVTYIPWASVFSPVKLEKQYPYFKKKFKPSKSDNKPENVSICWYPSHWIGMVYEPRLDFYNYMSSIKYTDEHYEQQVYLAIHILPTLHVFGFMNSGDSNS